MSRFALLAVLAFGFAATASAQTDPMEVPATAVDTVATDSKTSATQWKILAAKIRARAALTAMHHRNTTSKINS